MKVMIATPSFDKKVVAEYDGAMTQTIMELEARGIGYSKCLLGGDCFIDHARDRLADIFIKSDCTDLFFIDADMGWSPEGFIKVLSSDEEVVGGIYPKRNDNQEYHVIPHMGVDGRSETKDGLLRVSAISTGFLRIRRSALEKMISFYPEKYWVDGGATIHCFFKTEIVDHEWVGEDIGFCRQWATMGESLWIEPDIDFSHVGIKRWTGNYLTFLNNQIN